MEENIHPCLVFRHVSLQRCLIIIHLWDVILIPVNVSRRQHQLFTSETSSEKKMKINASDFRSFCMKQFYWASPEWYYVNQTHLTKTHLLKYIKPCQRRVCCPQSPSLTENSRSSVGTQSFRTQIACQMSQQAVQGTSLPSAGGELNCLPQHQHPDVRRAAGRVGN